MEEKKQETDYDRKNKNNAIGCLVILVIVTALTIWAMNL